MNKRIKSSRGFTLAELLIVVAIILVLVAIAVPIFTATVEKSREATDVSNVRSACSQVASAYMLGEEANDTVHISGTGTYYMFVSLVQQQDGWQTESLGSTSTDDSGSAHWVGTPKANGTAKVTCNAKNNVVVYWSGYESATVSDSAKDYETALNAVLSTIYDDVVADRLASSSNHVSYVLINGGKVTSVSCYSNKNGSSQASSGMTKEDLDALNADITKALEGTGYRLSTNSTARIFFDWDGNVVTNKTDSGYQMIGGQGASCSLDLMPTDSNKKIPLKNSTGVWDL